MSDLESAAEVRRAAISRVRHALSQTRDPRDLKLLQRTVWEELRRLEIPFRSCGINLIHFGSESRAIRVHRTDHGSVTLGEVDPGVRILRSIWRSGRPTYRRDLRSEDLWGEGEWMLPFGIRSVIDVPFTHGTLAVNSEQPGAFSDEHLEILEEFAQLLSATFSELESQAHGSEEESDAGEERRRLTQARLREEVWRMRNSSDLGRVVEAVRASVEDLEIPFGDCGIHTVDAGGLVTSQMVAWDGGRSEISPGPNEAVARVCASGETRHWRNLAARPAGWDSPVADARAPVGSAVAVPFARGALTVTSMWPRAFDSHDVRALEEMAQILTEGCGRLEDFRVLEDRTAELELAQAQLEEQTALLAAFQQIAELALSSLETDDLVDQLSQQIVDIGIFRSLVIALVDDDAGTVSVVKGVRRDLNAGILEDETEQVRATLDLNDTDIFACAARNGELEVVDGWDGERFAPKDKDPSEYEGRVAYFVPLKSGDRVVAVLATGSDREDRQRMLDRIELMGPLLRQVSVALEKARLYEELRESQRVQGEEARLRKAEDAVRLQIARMQGTADLDDVVGAIMDQLRQLGLPCDACSIQIVNQEADDFFSFGRERIEDDGDEKFNRFGPDLRGHPFGRGDLDWPKLTRNADDYPWVVDAWRSGTPHHQPHSRAVAGVKGGYSIVDVPFSHGTLAINARRPDVYTDGHVALLQRFAVILSEGAQRFVDLATRQHAQDQLHRAHVELEERVEERTSELRAEIAERQRGDDRRRALNLVREAVWQMQDADAIEAVLDACRKALEESDVPFRESGINVVDTSGAEPMVSYYNAEAKRWTAATAERGRDTVLAFWRQGEPEYRRDLSSDDPYGESGHLQRVFTKPIRSVIDVPFPQGTLAINSTEPEAFTDQDIALFQDMAGILSVGFRRLEDMRRLEERNVALEKEIADRRQRDRQQQSLELVRNAVLRMKSVTEMGAVLDACKRALDLAEVHYDDSGINEVDVSNPQPIVRYYKPDTQQWNEYQSPSAVEIILRVWREGETAYRRDLGAHDPYGERDFFAQHTDPPVHCIADVPFAYGTLAVSCVTPNAFTDRDLILFRDIADILSVGYRRLEDMKRLEQRNRDLELEIAEREQAERERGEIARVANEREERFRAVVDGAADGIITVDESGCIESLNPAAERIFGADRQRLIGRPAVALLSPEHVTGHGDPFDVLLERSGQSIGQEAEGRRVDGTTFPMELDLSEFRVGELRMLAGIVRDISERKALESQLVHSQKMEAVGRLAGGIAHDINNVLTAINTYTQFLGLAIASDDDSCQDVEGIKSASERAAALTRQLLAFSRRQVLQPRNVNLNTVVEDVHRMLSRLIQETIELRWRPASSLGLVKVDVGQIEQVVLNLAINASDAMPTGGVLSIATANQSREEAQGDLPAGRYVVLSVQDTGVGMDADTQGRIFEPFFSTKSPEKGTGLGLATVYGIVTQSGGHIRVCSELGQGSRFEIYLPRIEADLSQDSGSGAPATTLPRGTETILVVEDQAELRQVTGRLLREYGYTVMEACDGLQALETVRDDGGSIDLLLTDVVMPKMDGRELAEALAAEHRGIRICYMSGYTDDASVRQGVEEQSVNFIQKPFTGDFLLQSVREALDR